MGPEKRKAGKRRLTDMNAAEPERAWAPDLEPEWPPFEDTFPISEDARYVQKFSLDEYGRLVEWAVVQMRRDGDRWRRVAVYDICHGKGVHVHLGKTVEEAIGGCLRAHHILCAAHLDPRASCGRPAC